MVILAKTHVVSWVSGEVDERVVVGLEQSTGGLKLGCIYLKI